jgi:aspartyl/asparaginyl-tRNA synthetase
MYDVFFNGDSEDEFKELKEKLIKKSVQMQDLTDYLKKRKNGKPEHSVINCE